MSPNLRQLYDEHAPALFAFLLNFTRREADARDILQELFFKLVAQPELLAGVENTRAFLLRLAHRQAIDAHRHARGEWPCSCGEVHIRASGC